MFHLFLTSEVVKNENYLKYYLWAGTPFINGLLVAIEIWTELYAPCSHCNWKIAA